MTTSPELMSIGHAAGEAPAPGGPRVETFFPSRAEVESLDGARRRAFAYGVDRSGGRTPAGHRLSPAVLRVLNTIGPEFGLCARDPDGTLLGTLRAGPACWDGSPDSLQTFTHYGRPPHAVGSMLGPVHKLVLLASAGRLHPLLRGRLAAIRRETLRTADAMFLVEMLILEAGRGRRLPSLLIGDAMASARRLGLRRVFGAFRPSAYGRWKQDRGAGTSAEDFATYCSSTREDGRPLDPWLRTLERCGLRFHRCDVAAIRFSLGWEEFRRFKSLHKPGDWYEPTPGTWECGETHSWHVDPLLRAVHVVEPAVWGSAEL